MGDNGEKAVKSSETFCFLPYGGCLDQIIGDIPIIQGQQYTKVASEPSLGPQTPPGSRLAQKLPGSPMLSFWSPAVLVAPNPEVRNYREAAQASTV